VLFLPFASTDFGLCRFITFLRANAPWFEDLELFLLFREGLLLANSVRTAHCPNGRSISSFAFSCQTDLMPAPAFLELGVKYNFLTRPSDYASAKVCLEHRWHSSDSLNVHFRFGRRRPRIRTSRVTAWSCPCAAAAAAVRRSAPPRRSAG
jgi:hypothetical protein